MGNAPASTVCNAPGIGHALALNASQGGERLAALCFELPSDAHQGVMPRTITLIPAPGADGMVRGVDGRAWRLQGHEHLLAAWNRARAITENHAGRLAAPQGGSAPAFGWIERVRAEADGRIVGDVEWTPRGVTALQQREYRYLSPEFEHDAQGNILALVGAALTNDPNFPQLALNRETDPEHPPMNLTAIARALGIATPETADEAAVLAAINRVQTERQTALNAAQHPDPTQFVPIETHNVALNRATTAETELQQIRTANRDAEISTEVDGAVQAGKIVPANREYYVAMCRTERGLEKFREFVEQQPVIGDPSSKGEKPAGGGTALNAQEQQICTQLGITAEEFLAARTA